MRVIAFVSVLAVSLIFANRADAQCGAKQAGGCTVNQQAQGGCQGGACQAKFQSRGVVRIERQSALPFVRFQPRVIQQRRTVVVRQFR
jgi:hypothetical protein